jgi:predicted Ser/Thr protein kinase
MPTIEAPVAETLHVARIISSDSIPAGGFTPGTILADRYRVIGLLGRGGMGEVYRADDLKLGQAVALKFLPPKLADDAVRRERFFAEVRITRQLSHPNICRVYDIGEIEGRHFLSMEFIDGEDLASLLKRIGHLTNEKALDIARQLAAGLAAAHERGVLHRDLKPANIMLDGHGRVRITDFGLAIAVEDESQATEIAGTPAYMAPEQLAGKGATVRSDIYSLGLILYEIYTGKKAFTARTLAELREQKETHTPRAPSELRGGIYPIVERLIARCMERDPNARPASVAQLAQALPGGDPLAAALAAGETPSPEMVAASGSKEGLQPLVAWGLLGFLIVGVLAALMIKDRTYLHERIPFEKPPEALVERSQDILKKAGFTEKFESNAYGFMQNSDLLRYIEESDIPMNRLDRLDSKAILFWYRQSPRSLGISELNSGSTSPSNPPIQYSGEILITLDTEGHLVALRTVPPQVQSENQAVSLPDWASLFREAGLNMSDWTPANAQWSPFSYAETRSAWIGRLPNLPEKQVRIEASAFLGKPVSFAVIYPWTRASQMEPTQRQGRELLLSIGAGLLLAIPVMGGLILARRNMKLGRGDRRGAKRVAIFVLALLTLIWALNLPQVSVVSLLISPYAAVLTWIFYIAVEPSVRRRWPQILISWTRLVSGNWRDPLVARDIFVGLAIGILSDCMTIIIAAIPLQSSWTGFNRLRSIDLSSVLGARFTLIPILGELLEGIFFGLAFVCLLVIMRVLLRNQKVAVTACILIGSIAFAAGPAAGLITSLLLFFVLLRFGFLAMVFSIFTFGPILSSPMTLQASAWYSGYGFFALAILAAVVFYAFYTSLGGRPLISTPQLDD